MAYFAALRAAWLPERLASPPPTIRGMDEELKKPSGGIGAAIMAIAKVASLPVLYLLSMGPAVVLRQNGAVASETFWQTQGGLTLGHCQLLSGPQFYPQNGHSTARSTGAQSQYFTHF